MHNFLSTGSDASPRLQQSRNHTVTCGVVEQEKKILIKSPLWNTRGWMTSSRWSIRSMKFCLVVIVKALFLGIGNNILIHILNLSGEYYSLRTLFLPSSSTSSLNIHYYLAKYEKYLPSLGAGQICIDFWFQGFLVLNF